MFLNVGLSYSDTDYLFWRCFVTVLWICFYILLLSMSWQLLVNLHLPEKVKSNLKSHLAQLFLELQSPLKHSSLLIFWALQRSSHLTSAQVSTWAFSLALYPNLPPILILLREVIQVQHSFPRRPFKYLQLSLPLPHVFSRLSFPGGVQGSSVAGFKAFYSPKLRPSPLHLFCPRLLTRWPDVSQLVFCSLNYSRTGSGVQGSCVVCASPTVSALEFIHVLSVSIIFKLVLDPVFMKTYWCAFCT